jgi:hypothetical protein
LSGAVDVERADDRYLYVEVLSIKVGGLLGQELTMAIGIEGI